MISAQRIRFSWPTVESTWEEIANTSDPQVSTLVAWKGKLVGEVLVRLFMALAIVTYFPLLLVPRFPMGFRLVGVYGSGRAFLVRWLLWEFYFGPKPPTIVVPPPGAKGLTDEQIEGLCLSMPRSRSFLGHRAVFLGSDEVSREAPRHS